MTPRDRAQRGYTTVLQRLQHGTAQHVAKSMGVSDSDLSKIKNSETERVLLLLAHLGLKLADVNARCLEPSAFEFLTKTHERLARQSPTLLWTEDAE